MIKIYCISSCDKCRLAKKLMADTEIEHSFVDYRKDGIQQSVLESWIEKFGIDRVLNTRSATWRTTDDALKAELSENPYKVLTSNPAMIFRPIVDLSDDILVGKDALDWMEANRA